MLVKSISEEIYAELLGLYHSRHYEMGTAIPVKNVGS